MEESRVVDVKVPLSWEDRACLRSCPLPVEGTFQMQNTARRAKIAVSDDGQGIVSHAGALLMTETARITGLQHRDHRQLRRGNPRRPPRPVGRRERRILIPGTQLIPGPDRQRPLPERFAGHPGPRAVSAGTSGHGRGCIDITTRSRDRDGERERPAAARSWDTSHHQRTKRPGVSHTNKPTDSTCEDTIAAQGAALDRVEQSSSPKLLGPVHADLRHDLGKRCPGWCGVLAT